MMTEREAWEFLEMIWINAELKDCKGLICVQIGPGAIQGHYGLCDCIYAMRYRNRLIDEEVCTSMINKISPLPRLDSECGYKWVLTPEGAAARARFCREQTAKLKDSIEEAQL